MRVLTAFNYFNTYAVMCSVKLQNISTLVYTVSCRVVPYDTIKT